MIKLGAIALIKNEEGKILMLYRKKEPAKNLWAIPGGKVEMYERLEDTVKREMKEELNVDVEIIRFLCNIEDINEEKELHWIMPVYEVKIINGTPKNMEENSHKEMKWFDLDEIPSNISFMTKKVIEKIETMNN